MPEVEIAERKFGVKQQSLCIEVRCIRLHPYTARTGAVNFWVVCRSPLLVVGIPGTLLGTSKSPELTVPLPH